MRWLVFGMVALGLASPTLAQPAPSGDPACRAERARFAVGQPYSKALARRALSRTGATVVRVIKPGRVHTMEFRGDRLNLEVGPRGRVRAVRCG